LKRSELTLYLAQIRPTPSGTLVVFTLAFLFPLLVDILLLARPQKFMPAFPMTGFHFKAYLGILSLTLAYLAWRFLFRSLLERALHLIRFWLDRGPGFGKSSTEPEKDPKDLEDLSGTPDV
jgi:hypothetical protein